MSKDKKIMLVYQDCPLCGVHKAWGEAQIKKANTKGYNVEKVPFFKSGAKEWIFEALKSGVSLPFFTDGEKFSKNVDDIVKKTRAKKTSTKSKRKTEVIDGIVSKSA